jgi:Tol biopolymer transport system component
MLRLLPFLAALITSLLLASSITAAPRRLTPQFQIYLPQILTSPRCAPTPPWEVPLVLPTVPLAFIDAGDIWLFHATNCSVEVLTHGANTFAFAWSPDATRIAFVSSDAFTQESAIKVVRLADHQVITLIRWTDGHSAGSPSWSPDGQRIAFDLGFLDGTEAHSSIMVMQANGTQIQQLSATGYDFAPDWSPDGRRIAFISVPYVGAEGKLYLMRADGRNVTPLTGGLGVVSRVVWSSDGTRLALSKADWSGALFVIAASGGAKTLLPAPQGGLLNELGGWSPDGRQFVYEQVYAHGSLLAVIKVDGSAFHGLWISGTRPEWAPR